jgi:hypothetical protein
MHLEASLAAPRLLPNSPFIALGQESLAGANLLHVAVSEQLALLASQHNLLAQAIPFAADANQAAQAPGQLPAPPAAIKSTTMLEARLAEAEALAVKLADAAHAAERRAAASQDAADRARDLLADARAEAERSATAMEDLRRGAAQQEARTQEVLAAQRAALADLDAARRELADLRIAEAKVFRPLRARAAPPARRINPRRHIWRRELHAGVFSDTPTGVAVDGYRPPHSVGSCWV